MSKTLYDNFAKEIAEGRGRQAVSQHASLGSSNSPGLPLFQRYVVLDTIFDPQIIDATKLEYWEHTIGVTNIKFATVAPRNAIIAQRVNNNIASPVEKPMILYPFFPPQLSLPCKPGEHVWVMFEDPTGTKNDLGYWMCRIVTAGFVEDVNHTHPHRIHDPSFSPGTRDQFEGTDKATYEFRNGSTSEQGGERYTVPGTATLSGDDDVYPSLMKESDGGKISHYESVPRYRKRPEETVIEGNNNALLVMGRDRVGSAASYVNDVERGRIPKIPESDNILDGAGRIDIVAGRGQTPTTGGKTVQNALGNKELAKSSSDVAINEGDPDYSTDRSRILVSQRTSVDANFELSSFNSDLEISDSPDGDGAIVIKSDKLRFIARSDVEILVTTYTRDENGNMITVEDTSMWAALIIKTNGDIVFRPAQLGFIKLGGDDADKGVLCSDLPVTTQNGTVAGAPLLTTMGGLFGGAKPGAPGENSGALASGQGKFASKVLIK